jgi:hypothetical protein
MLVAAGSQSVFWMEMVHVTRAVTAVSGTDPEEGASGFRRAMELGWISLIQAAESQVF